MMNKKSKLMACVLAGSMFLSGCKMEIDSAKNFINKIKDDIDKRVANKSSSNEPVRGEIIPVPTETEAVLEFVTEPIVEETILPTIPETTEITIPTEPIIVETTIATEPVIEETEEIIIETTIATEPIIEETEPIIEQSQNDVVVYAIDEVNIRSSNTTNSLRIGSLQINDSAIKLLSYPNGWELIKSNDIIGFVNNNYIYYSDEIVETEYKHTIKNDIVLTNCELNFRIAPTTSSKIIQRFPKNAELQVVAEVDNGWLLVRVDGVLGYVSAEYTTSLFDKVREQYPDFDLSNLEVKKVVYSKAYDLNIRNGNSTDYERIDGLTIYETVRVLGEYDGWYLVMTNGYEFGFVSKDYTRDLDDVFVIVDLSEQRLYLYDNNVLCYDTPVTTGKDSTPSDIGLFKIYDKVTEKYLIGIDEKTGAEEYRSFVNYWMPYNGGEGLHDATWRGVFGTSNYTTNGSHGCINMPLAITDEIYNTVSIGTKVLVHK